MIEDQPGRGESEEAGVIREKRLKEHEHPGREIPEEADVTEKEK